MKISAKFIIVLSMIMLLCSCDSNRKDIADNEKLGNKIFENIKQGNFTIECRDIYAEYLNTQNDSTDFVQAQYIGDGRFFLTATHYSSNDNPGVDLRDTGKYGVLYNNNFDTVYEFKKNEYKYTDNDGYVNSVSFGNEYCYLNVNLSNLLLFNIKTSEIKKSTDLGDYFHIGRDNFVSITQNGLSCYNVSSEQKNQIEFDDDVITLVGKASYDDKFWALQRYDKDNWKLNQVNLKSSEVIQKIDISTLLPLGNAIEMCGSDKYVVITCETFNGNASTYYNLNTLLYSIDDNEFITVHKDYSLYDYYFINDHIIIYADNSMDYSGAYIMDLSTMENVKIDGIDDSARFVRFIDNQIVVKSKDNQFYFVSIND